MKIFISHAEKDKELVRNFVDLLYAIGLQDKDMFCSSIVDLGVPNNEDIFDYLKNMFDKEQLYVLFMLSDNYYRSAACLNEMGAAWIKKTKYITFLLPGFDFKEIVGAINPRQIAIKLDGDVDTLKARLNLFKDELIELFDVNISYTRWEIVREKFLQSIKTDTNINMSDAETYCIGDNLSKGCVLTSINEKELCVKIDFSNTNSDMSSVVLFPMVYNWSQWAQLNRKLCFKIRASDKIHPVDLELKFPRRNIKYRISIDAEVKEYKIPLQDICRKLDYWKEVKEICFLFEKENFTDEINVYITDLTIK